MATRQSSPQSRRARRRPVPTQSDPAQLQLDLDLSASVSRSIPSTSPSPTVASDPTPAKRLSGVTLDHGWIVGNRMPITHDATGGNFSIPYTASRNGHTVFLKAMDYTAALHEADPAKALQSMTEAFIFERDLLNRCKRLSRVVRMLDHGTYKAGHQPADVVQYIIFEMADGDVRKMIRSSNRFDLAWALRAMHQSTAALRQLHSIDIAHQDIKPSNLLTFGQNNIKVADLGRASERSAIPRPADFEFAGDRGYAPPEILYGSNANDWQTGRLASDIYMLGSMILFLFSGAAMTPSLLNKLAASHRPPNWHGPYNDIMPYLIHSMSDIVNSIRKRRESCSEAVATAIQQLCHPDPAQRGHPKDRRRNQFSLERYVSQFDLLARRAEWSLRYRA